MILVGKKYEFKKKYKKNSSTNNYELLND